MTGARRVRGSRRARAYPAATVPLLLAVFATCIAPAAVAVDVSTGAELLAAVNDYRKLYVTLQEDGSEDDLSYIKLINYGERVLTNRMRAYLPQRIVQFLTATHPTKHTIYLCRHGQSEYNTTGRLGGNSPITEKGWVFAEILARFAAEHVCNLKEVKTPQSTLCSDLVSCLFIYLFLFIYVCAIRMTACFVYH